MEKWVTTKKKPHGNFKVDIEVLQILLNCYSNFYLIPKALYRNIAIFSQSIQKQNPFIRSNTRLKLAKNQAEAKQHPEAELLLFENHSLSSFLLSSKNKRRHSKSVQKASLYVLKRLYD